MLVTSLKALADLLLAFVNEGRRSTQANFDHYYEPCYTAAKTVFEDYTALFCDMRSMIEGGAPLPDIVRFLRDRRTATLSLRHELRAIIPIGNARNRELMANPPDFETAILGILSGAYSTAHALEHFQKGISTQLVFDDECRRTGESPEDTVRFRESLLAQLDFQFRYIEECFVRVAQHYTAARKALLSKSIESTHKTRNA